ncbi:MAG TPA: hypothetical protein VFG83_19135 [Kofleriaceae bacterium]|nr:hypothetical protein [Kofleriaceae bacterium]
MATHLAVADYGLGRMTLAIDGREVVRQSQRFAGDVCYRRALRSALESWLADGDDALSPRALAAGSCTCGRRTTPVDRAACYLNRPELSLRLATTADVAPRVLRKSWVFIIGRAPSAGTMHMAMVRRQRVPGEGIWARNIGREVDERFSASGRAQPP